MNEAAQAFMAEHWRGVLGTSYTPEGESPEGGFDCWGFARYVYWTQGIQLPRAIHEAARLFRRVEPPFQFPDLLVFKLLPAFERHVGVALDDTWMIQCARSTNGVSRVQRTRDLWRQSFTHGVRYRCT